MGRVSGFFSDTDEPVEILHRLKKKRQNANFLYTTITFVIVLSVTYEISHESKLNSAATGNGIRGQFT